MQNVSANWGELFSSPHRTEYRFDIAGTAYYDADLKDTPVIKKPFMDKPAIGRCCTGSIQLKIYPKGDIPKAASVNAYCRLADKNGNTTSWLPQGKFYISTRRGKEVLQLNCLDRMIKAGTTYLDKTSFTSWPQPMSDVLSEICSIMDVTLDDRTEIETGESYFVDYPNEDVSISEILSGIAAAHGGNWIMTESGKLRLVVFASPTTVNQNLGTAHTGYTERGKLQTVSRVILSDNAGNQFTAGDNSGAVISAECNYANQVIASALCDDDDGILYGVTYQPYSLTGAYLDPAIELGDTISVTDKDGEEHNVVVFSINMNCTVAATCALSAAVDSETEDEYPYVTIQQLAISRTLKTNQSYFGNRINRKEGFVSELLVDGESKAKLTANATVFSMQQNVNGSWEDRIYFDTASGKYVISSDVIINGVVKFVDLSTGGRSTINGDNIITGKIKNSSGSMVIDLDEGTITVDGQDVASALKTVENSITLLASSQIFTKASDASSFVPSTITLTASTSGAIASYQWYKNDVLISGQTGSTLSITPSDVSGNSATYKVVGTDADGNTYTDVISIAKLSDGKDGEDGQDGAPGAAGRDGTSSNSAIVYLYKRSASTPTIDWSQSLTYSFTSKSITSSAPSGWSKTIISGTNPLYVTAATAYSDTDTDTIAASEWSTPVKLAENGKDGQDGQDGAPGTAGANGLNVATVTLYKRAASTPAKPTSTLTYTFATGVLSGTLSSWSQTIPATDGNPCYCIQATASSTAATDTIAASEWSTVRKIVEDGKDGEDGQDGAPGAAGRDGTDGYTVILGDEYIEIPVYSTRIPVSAASYSCTVKTYKGVSALTPVSPSVTLQAGQFKVEVLNSISGVSVTQATAGTIVCSVNTGRSEYAIPDSAELSLKITVYGGFVINTAIVIRANMNNVTVAQESTITAQGSEIALKVNKNGVIAAINISPESVVIDASKVDLTGLVTVSSLAAGTTTINGGCITTGTIDASDVSIINLNASNIKAGTLSANYIRGGTLNFNNISVSNLSANNITSGTLDCSKVTVSNLSAGSIKSGTLDCSLITVANLSASMITSGTLSADRINVDTLYVNKLYTGKTSTSKTMVSYNGTNTVYVGGDGSSWNSSNTFIYGSSNVSIGYYNQWGYRAVFDTSTRCFRPENTTYGWTLGSSTYPWGALYTKESCIGTSVAGKVGFFGATPVAKKKVTKPTTSADLSSLRTVVINLCEALHGYGLLSNV